jgi:hypothetical protein
MSQRLQSLFEKQNSHMFFTLQCCMWAQSVLSAPLEYEAPSQRLFRSISLRTVDTFVPISRAMNVKVFLSFSPRSIKFRFSLLSCGWALVSLFGITPSSFFRYHSRQGDAHVQMITKSED